MIPAFSLFIIYFVDINLIILHVVLRNFALLSRIPHASCLITALQLASQVNIIVKIYTFIDYAVLIYKIFPNWRFYRCYSEHTRLPLTAFNHLCVLILIAR